MFLLVVGGFRGFLFIIIRPIETIDYRIEPIQRLFECLDGRPEDDFLDASEKCELWGRWLGGFDLLLLAIGVSPLCCRIEIL